MTLRFLLDTSALIAHYRQEPGWARVQALFEEGGSEVLTASVSLTEFARRLRELETGQRLNPTIETLVRYADAVGKRLGAELPGASCRESLRGDLPLRNYFSEPSGTSPPSPPGQVPSGVVSAGASVRERLRRPTSVALSGAVLASTLSICRLSSS